MPAGLVPAEARRDPFIGFAPQPVQCRWLSADDEARAKSAEIIRLVVDENRGSSEDHAINEVYQRNTLAEIQGFLGFWTGLVVTPAGMITLAVD